MNWFADWVGVYCTATGADGRAADMLRANVAIVVEHWKATPAELGEVTNRLISSCRVPKFANEHIDAIGKELVALRTERKAAADHVKQFGPFKGCDCPACNGGVVLPQYLEAQARLRSILNSFGQRPPRRGR